MFEEVEMLLTARGFREVDWREEVIEDDYWKRSQEVFLKNPVLWDWKWKRVGELAVGLPSGYLSWSGASAYVKAPRDGTPKLVIAYWNRYETGVPKTETWYVRRDLEYVIIVSEGTPEKIAVDGVWIGSERGVYRVYAVKGGEVVYEKALRYGPYDYYFNMVDWGKLREMVEEALAKLSGGE